MDVDVEVQVHVLPLTHPLTDGNLLQGGPAKVKPTLLVTFECAGKIQ